MMDISTLTPRNAFVNLEHPGTGEELGLVFETRSRHSDEVQKVTRDYDARNQPKRGRGKEPSLLEKRAHSRDLILASVVGWKWTDPKLVFDGEQPAYTYETLKKWLKDYPWMVEFFSRAFLEDENFFENSGNSSLTP